MAYYVCFVCQFIVQDIRTFTYFYNVCEDEFKSKNQRHKPTVSAASLLASNRINFAIDNLESEILRIFA